MDRISEELDVIESDPDKAVVVHGVKL